MRVRKSSEKAELSNRQLRELYRYLYETRRLEEHLVALYRQNKVVGGVYRSLGQEATAVGCAYGLREGDFMQPLIRDLGALLVHGAKPIAMFRQYMAKSTGPSAGRELNTHFSDPAVGIMGPVSMLGAMIPVIAGCLLAARLKGESKAGLCFIGDGGSSTGAFYEGLNFAAVQKLPLIVVIEANHYAYSTPTISQAPNGDLLQRALGFGVPVTVIDGNDVLACYEATTQARQRAIRGEGPSVIVSETYRRRGHAEHDNQAYVPAEEIINWQTHNDPLTRYEHFMKEEGIATAEDQALISDKVETELNLARDEAVDEPLPNPDSIEHGVFDDGHRPWPSSDTWFRGGPPYRGTPHG
jgi:TPP-dependent pyruvate/acetoin dehydrogenase alpha subunit